MNRQRARLVLLLCLLPALPPLRGMFEASMALLMLVQLPCLFAAGCLAPALLPARHHARHHARLVVRLRPYALTLFVIASVAYGVWMLPIALDLSRMSRALGVARDIAACVAGLAMVIAVRGAPWPLVLFFGGNMVWMGLTFGMLFVDAQTRLCANYLLGDQRIAGIGLMAYAIAGCAWLLVWAARQAETARSVVHQKKLKKSGRLPIKAASEKGPDKSKSPA